MTQYNWLINTVRNSTAKYKFLFSHQIVASDTHSGQNLYGHGGVDSAKFVEWGGYDTDGTTYTWSTNRPSSSGWGSNPSASPWKLPMSPLFSMATITSMAMRKLNGMVYQEVPNGSFTGSFGIYTTGGNSGNTIWADSTQGHGHLQCTVSPCQTQVEFIRTGGTSRWKPTPWLHTAAVLPLPRPREH